LNNGENSSIITVIKHSNIIHWWSTIKVSKDTLRDIQTSLQHAQENIDFFQLESQLQQEELQQWSHHSEPVSVKKIETYSHKQQDNNVTIDSDPVPNKATVVHANAEIEYTLPNLVIRPWEELVHNKHRTGLGYDTDVSSHIPNYSKPIHFQSAGFLHDSSPSIVLDYAPLPQ